MCWLHWWVVEFLRTPLCWDVGGLVVSTPTHTYQELGDPTSLPAIVAMHILTILCIHVAKYTPTLPKASDTHTHTHVVQTVTEFL